MGRSKPIKVNSTVKARVKAERTPPAFFEGMYATYKSKKKKSEEAEKVKDSLQRVIIELKAQLKKK